jgi:hypothetical protein
MLPSQVVDLICEILDKPALVPTDCGNEYNLLTLAVFVYDNFEEMSIEYAQEATDGENNVIVRMARGLHARGITYGTGCSSN